MAIFNSYVKLPDDDHHDDEYCFHDDEGISMNLADFSNTSRIWGTKKGWLNGLFPWILTIVAVHNSWIPPSVNIC